MEGSRDRRRPGPFGAGLPISLQDVLDSVEDEVLVMDTVHRIRFANRAARRNLTKEAETVVGELCYSVLEGRDTPCAAPLWDCPIRTVLQSGTMTTLIHADRAPSGDRYLKISSYPLRDKRGSIRGVVELRRDVTAEKDLETQIMRRHHQLLALSHISGAVSGARDLDATLRIALDNVLEIVGSAVGGILLVDEEAGTLRYRVYQGLSASFAEGMRLSLGEGIAGRVAQVGEALLVEDISTDPRAAHSDLVSSEGIKGFISIPLRTKDRIVGVMNVASHQAGRFRPDDVSLLKSIGDYLGTTIEQTRLNERLARVGERNRQLLRYALTAQEAERRRIARELHDETSQAITSLTLSLQAIITVAEMKGIGDPDFLDRVRSTHAFAVQAGSDVVQLMKELRPTLLDELGMTAAIGRYAKSTLGPLGVNVTTEFVGVDRRFSPEVEVTLFRIAQGAIGNVVKHAQARNVFIRLECNDKECALEISDDGKGFDVSKLTGVGPDGKGAGLFIMRERTSMAGGVGYVESSPGKGTRVIARIPVLTDGADEKDKGAGSR